MTRKFLAVTLAAVCLAGAKPAAAQFLYYPGWFKTMPNGSTLTDTGAGVFSFSGGGNTATMTIGSSGLVVFGADVSGANWQGQAQIRAGSTSSIFWNGRTGMKAPFDGGLRIAKSDDSQPTVSGLGTCNSGADGVRAFVIDATATTFASTVSGGGSSHVPVYCDGSASAWKIG